MEGDRRLKRAWRRAGGRRWRLPALLLAALVASPLASARAGTNYVIGDSNSLPRAGGTTNWATEAFGDDHVNRAVGAASTYDYLASCKTSCWWTEGAGPDDVFWIMLGIADPADNPQAGMQSYALNMAAMFHYIPSDHIRLITSPYMKLNRKRNAFVDEMAIVDQLLCEASDRVTCVADPREVLDRTLHYRDLIHLNDEGHRLLAAMLVVPEPATGLLVAMGLAWLGRRGARARLGHARRD